MVTAICELPIFSTTAIGLRQGLDYHLQQSHTSVHLFPIVGSCCDAAHVRLSTGKAMQLDMNVPKS